MGFEDVSKNSLKSKRESLKNLYHMFGVRTSNALLSLVSIIYNWSNR